MIGPFDLFDFQIAFEEEDVFDEEITLSMLLHVSLTLNNKFDSLLTSNVRIAIKFAYLGLLAFNQTRI